jgi:hypothetical protein
MRGPTNKALRRLLVPFAWVLVRFVGWMQKKHWHYMVENAKGRRKYIVRGVLTFFFFYFLQKFFPGFQGIKQPVPPVPTPPGQWPQEGVQQ